MPLSTADRPKIGADDAVHFPEMPPDTDDISAAPRLARAVGMLDVKHPHPALEMPFHLYGRVGQWMRTSVRAPAFVAAMSARTPA